MSQLLLGFVAERANRTEATVDLLTVDIQGRRSCGVDRRRQMNPLVRRQRLGRDAVVTAVDRQMKPQFILRQLVPSSIDDADRHAAVGAIERRQDSLRP